MRQAIPSPGSVHGVATGGLPTFTRSLAFELAPLRGDANAVAPGAIRTAMHDSKAH
ncbi:MAG: SDR family oxidoreductase [Chloroflexi bacterium]|nr:SDR family oxidoreductase [Chloroflexota bacterium]